MPYVQVPKSGQTLGQTRDQIRDNIQALNASLELNHVGLDQGAQTGKHKFIEIPVSSPNNIAGEGTLYTSTTGGETQLNYINDGQGNVYQLTRTINGSYTRFSTNTNYSGTLSGGWTFLPGGMLLQYGIATSSGVALPNTVVTLPVTLTNAPYSVNCTILTTADSRFFVEVYDVATNQFRAVTRDSGGSKTSGIDFYWQVIKARQELMKMPERHFRLRKQPHKRKPRQ